MKTFNEHPYRGILKEKLAFNLKNVTKVLKKINTATASYLSRYYIDASPNEIGRTICGWSEIESVNPDATFSRKVWRLKE